MHDPERAGTERPTRQQELMDEEPPSAGETSTADASLPNIGLGIRATTSIDHAFGTVGRYEVRGRLGRGAMGTVLEAFDPQLDRRVALKVLHDEPGTPRTARLLREAKALAKLSHPNVVQVYEVGQAQDQAFVAMELVEGQTLEQWMKQEPRPGWRACVQVFIQAGMGLAAAHEQGLIIN